jgi:alkylmercury lyase
MSNDLSEPSRLAAEMVSLMMRTPGVMEASGLTRPIVELLSEGRPVSVEAIAARSGLVPARVRYALERSRHAEWTEDGRLEGFGLTLRPTPHSLQIENRVWYVWNGAEALLFAALLDRPALIRTSCHVTGVPIRIDVAPNGVLRAAPAASVMSVLAHPGRHAQLSRLDSTRQVFFRSLDAASPWTVENPGYALLDSREAFAYCRQLASLL